MKLENIQIKRKYFVKPNSGGAFRVKVSGISRKGYVKCTEILDGSHFVCKPEELYEEVDYKDLDALLNKAENKINNLRRELKGNYAELLDKYNCILESEKKLFADAMVLPTFNDNWRDKFFEIIQDRGIPVSKEYLYEIFNPERYHEYDKSNPMPYDLFGIEGFITDIYQRNYGLLFEDLEDFLRLEYHRLNPELDNKPYSLDDLINNGYIDQMYTTMQEELFDKIDTEDFKNFVLSIAE